MSKTPSACRLGTIVKGFFILLPALIAYLMIGQLFDMMMALTQRIFDMLPGTNVEDESDRRAISALLLILSCFLIGLFDQSAV